MWRGVALSADDQLRAELIQQLMCQGEVDGAVLGQRHGVDFEQYFAEDLRSVQRLQEDGLAEYRDGVVRASEPGLVAAAAGDVLRPVPACGLRAAALLACDLTFVVKSAMVPGAGIEPAWGCPGGF